VYSAAVGTITGALHVHPDGSCSALDCRGEIPAVRDGLVEVTYDYGPGLIPDTVTGDEGMWRWRDLLPLGPGLIRYPLPVGGTPLLAAPGLREELGMAQLFLKDETRSPTGSNKDRATALSLEHCLREGIGTITAASTGNVAVSLSVGAAAAGMRAVIFVPAAVGEGKLRLMLLAGATVFKVVEGYEAAYRLSRRTAATFGWYDRNTGANPLTVEAKKTVALEIWEGLGREMPEAVVVPVGDGTTLSAMAKGFRELIACGVADRMPRIIGVQAEGCQPLKRVWEGKACEPVTGTIADGIYVDSPANALTAVRDVKESGGAYVAVSDREIRHAIVLLATRAGVIAEPAAAAATAGLKEALAAGYLQADERAVALVTGSGFKTPQFLEPTGRVFEIRGELGEVEPLL
jgi:threonine synthase